MPFERNNPLSAVLEIGIFNGPGSTFGSTHGSTPACTPPSMALVVLSDISPASILAQSRRHKIAKLFGLILFFLFFFGTFGHEGQKMKV